MDTQWKQMHDRIARVRSRLAQKWPQQYLLVCIKTGRLARGNVSDGHGGLMSASECFDAKYGTMEEVGESYRSFYGVRLSSRHAS